MSKESVGSTLTLFGYDLCRRPCYHTTASRYFPKVSERERAGTSVYPHRLLVIFDSYRGVAERADLTSQTKGPASVPSMHPDGVMQELKHRPHQHSLVVEPADGTHGPCRWLIVVRGSRKQQEQALYIRTPRKKVSVGQSVYVALSIMSSAAET